MGINENLLALAVSWSMSAEFCLWLDLLHTWSHSSSHRNLAKESAETSKDHFLHFVPLSMCL